MRLLTVVGARPQFIKAGVLSAALRLRHVEVLVHTGQHYDDNMSRIFFEELGIPEPDYHLGIGSSSHGVQTGAMLSALDPILHREKPDAVIVFGDTNSTLAGALAAAQCHIPVAHVEAGLRSFDRRMPEEVNRVVADHLATWRFAPSVTAQRLLANEGIVTNVHVVGDIMFDAVLLHAARARATSTYPGSLGMDRGAYFAATVHRAENTDDPVRLRAIMTAIGRLPRPVVLPVHPRTRRVLDDHGIRPETNTHVIDPLGYLDMLALVEASACLLTDSGGLQKEAYYLGVPCVTLRDRTEWVETVEVGWNVLAGTDAAAIVAAVKRQTTPRGAHPTLYGEGDTATRIVRVLESA